MRERSLCSLAALALLFVTASWGSTFFLIKDLLDRARWSTSWRCGSRSLRLSPRARKHGAILGLVYGLAQILQTTGLEHTAASVSGFVTGMYVVCTPLLAAVLLSQRIGRVTWIAVAVAFAGLAVLSLRGFAVGYGEAITFASAVLYALHIVGLGAWATARDAFGLSVLQLAVIALVCGVSAVPDGVVLPASGGDWLAVVYMALVAGALALVAQTWAQAHLTPTRSAIIMSMEPVWAAFFAVLLGGESLTARMLVGGVLVLTAMYLVELAPRRHLEGEVQHLTV